MVTLPDGHEVRAGDPAADQALRKALGPDDVVDARRFRPNIVIETGWPAGFVENDWIGRRATIGEGVVEFT